LSFPGSGDYLGDIAISMARARAQARRYGHALEDEIRILMLHGVLHLRGMNHESDSGEMARSELRWRRKFGLPTGLIERAA
jgi:probable rRNA maturation factor